MIVLLTVHIPAREPSVWAGMKTQEPFNGRDRAGCRLYMDIMFE